MDKRFWLILGGIIALLIGVFVITGGKADNSGSNFAGEPTEIQDDDRIVNPNASRDVVLIEYGDFECPGCGALHPVLKQMHQEFADNVTFVFRHFPLTNIHRNAFAAHRAAEAAHRQNQFFAMHDLLFENQEAWNGPSALDAQGVTVEQATSIFEQYAQMLELDIDQFKADFASEDVANTINSHVSSGRTLSLNSTPSLLLNGQSIPTPSSLEEMRQLLQAAVEEASQDS